MSRCATLALILSVAACEHAQPMPPNEPTVEAAKPEPAPPQPPVETASPARESAPAVAPVAPKPAPKPASRVAEPNAEAPAKKLVRKCNPMSRAACRWSEETDEREVPRVVKKPTEGSAP